MRTKNYVTIVLAPCAVEKSAKIKQENPHKNVKFAGGGYPSQ